MQWHMQEHTVRHKNIYLKKFNGIVAQKNLSYANAPLTEKSITDNPAQCKFRIILLKCLSTGHSK